VDVTSTDFFVPGLGPKKMRSSLTSSSDHFALFLPYVPLCLLPGEQVDPVTLAQGHLHNNMEVFYWELPYELVDLGRFHTDLHLRSNAVFGVKLIDWPTVLTYVHGAMVKGHDDVLWRFGLQELDIIDPTFRDVRVVKVYSFAVTSLCGSVTLRPHKYVQNVPKTYRIVANPHGTDDHAVTFVEKLERGIYPYDEASDSEGR
jgi:hypothetical protein